jgi:UDP:flavonoid glycosyltransferase YjiC (YdhE family)
MKIVFAISAPGHVNPMFAIVRILVADGHEVVAFTGRSFKDRIEGIGAEFHPIAASADQDLVAPFSEYPDLKAMPPGLELMRVVIERLFIDTIPVQHEGLQQVLWQVQPDVVIGDDCFLGLLPMLLGRRSKRPPIVCFGTTILHWPREDRAPEFLGLTPATTQSERDEYAAIAQEYNNVVNQPLARRLNHCLKSLGKGPLSTPPFETQVKLADSARCRRTRPHSAAPLRRRSASTDLGAPHSAKGAL